MHKTVKHSVRNLLFGLGLLSTLTLQPSPVFAQGTAFTYQGRLDNSGSPASGIYDLRFAVYDADSGGNLRGLLTNSAVAVSNGLFTTTLDFGFGVFNGSPRWLEIAVRSNGTASAFAPLAPRQAVLPSPYAFWAANASQAVTVSGTVPSSGLNGLYSNPVSFTSPANGFAGDGGGLNNVNAAQLGGRTAAQFWQTGGNAGTSAGAHFLGTTDNQPLEFRVNGQRALRLESNTNLAPNVIAGSPFNHASNMVVGATIGGGGGIFAAGDAYTNRVTAHFGTVGGGLGNTVGGNVATVGGGTWNTADGVTATVGGGYANSASGQAAVVSGGNGNTASGFMAVVSGGFLNSASGSNAFVGGGRANVASDNFSTVIGGSSNLASGRFSLAAGRQAKAFHDGSFVWADSQAASFNSTVSNQFAVRASGGLFLDGRLGIGVPSPGAHVDVFAEQATGRFASYDSANGSVLALGNSSISPSYLGAINFEDGLGTPGQIGYLANHSLVFRVGDLERMTLDASGLTVNGRPVLLAPTSGQAVEFTPDSASAWRLLPNGTSPNIIGGYSGNVVSNGVVGAFIGGGGNAQYPNRVGGNYGAVLGGANNTASGESSTAMGIGATASGSRSTAMGWDTTASGPYSTAMGQQTVASGSASTAAGFRSQARGVASTALGSETSATNNDATAMGRLTLAGGSASTAMGLETKALGLASTALGSSSSATNNDATAMGRLTLAGGSASTALGYRARALHNGSFVWADQQEADFDSTAANEFSLRASGGVRLANDTSLSFGNQTRQMLNLWNTQYAIGVQANAAYFRTDNEFLWYRGGSHSDTFGDPGSGGSQIMRLGNSGNLVIAGTLSEGSDRNVKQDFAPVDPQAVLEKVAALPIQSWAYTNAPGVKHYGPTAQDFHAAFALNGADDKHIATVDADGVALAAIQGLNEKVETGRRIVEAQALQLERKLEQQEAEIAELRQAVNDLRNLVQSLRTRSSRPGVPDPANSISK